MPSFVVNLQASFQADDTNEAHAIADDLRSTLQAQLAADDNDVVEVLSTGDAVGLALTDLVQMRAQMMVIANMLRNLDRKLQAVQYADPAIKPSEVVNADNR